MGLTAIVKPTHDCNLRCKYCYIEEGAERGRMSQETLQNTMEQVSEASGDEEAHFIWHGGEPLLIGLDFFKRAAAISHELRERGNHISNGIQSNGTLVTEELLDLIEREKDFYLGFSIDGPEAVNNKTRVHANGEGAFKDIFRGIKMAKNRNASVGGGAIAVVNKHNLPHLDKIYDFFNQERIGLKLNHIINATDTTLGISPMEYATAMNQLFDRWINDYQAIEIDPFSQIIGNFMTGRPSGCNYTNSCQEYFISVGPQGDIYPCGRFDGLKDYWMGNINSPGGLTMALESDVRKRLKDRKLETMAGCPDCEYVPICNGGCPHNALIAGDIMGKDPYCAGYKTMFKHIKSKMHQELTKAEVKGGNNERSKRFTKQV
jgi:uncharacterized protein